MINRAYCIKIKIIAYIYMKVLYKSLSLGINIMHDLKF